MSVTTPARPSGRSATFSSGPRRLAALAAVAGLFVAGCASADAGAPSSDDPLQARVDQGVTARIRLEADPAGLDEPASSRLQELLDHQGDGPLAVLSRSADGSARAAALGDGTIELRQVEDTVYLRLDVTGLEDAPWADQGKLTEHFEDLPERAGAMVPMLLDQGWVGVSGVTPEALSDLVGELPGGSTPWPKPSATPDADEHDWLGDLAERPDWLDEHLTIDANDGVATRLVVDLAGLAASDDLPEAPSASEHDGKSRPSHDHDAEQFREALVDADARLVVDLEDVGDRTDAPADALTIDLEQLEALFGS